MDQDLSPGLGVDLLERRDGVAGVFTDGPILHRIGGPVASFGPVLHRRANRLRDLIPPRPVLEEDVGAQLRIWWALSASASPSRLIVTTPWRWGTV